MANKTVRNSNLELLRIVSILLIIAMHVVGYAISKGELSTANTCLRYFIGSIGNLGVSCFVLISGYFGVRFTWRKFVFISLLTTVYACLCNFCNAGFSINRDVLMGVFWVPRYFNWYITCYLTLMVLSGHVNEFCSRLDEKEFAKLLIVLFVPFSLLPMLVSATETLLLRNGQCFTYFLYAYLVGRFIKQYKDVNPSRWVSGMIVLVMVLVMWLKGVASMKVGVLSLIPHTANNSPTILIASIAAFFLFKSFEIQSRLINYISSSVLAAYLLDQLKPTIDQYLCVYRHTQDSDFVLYLTLEVFVIFFVAIIIDKIRIHLLYKPEAWITNTLVLVFEMINLKINRIVSSLCNQRSQ